jgi:hypothetical protein
MYFQTYPNWLVLTVMGADSSESWASSGRGGGAARPGWRRDLEGGHPDEPPAIPPGSTSVEPLQEMGGGEAMQNAEAAGVVPSIRTTKIS